MFQTCLILCRELKKLSEESLTRQPDEVFDIVSKLGEGSYGSVFKAMHKESSQVLAIKKVRDGTIDNMLILRTVI